MNLKQDNTIGFKDIQLASKNLAQENIVGSAIKPQSDISLSFYSVATTTPTIIMTRNSENKIISNNDNSNVISKHFNSPISQPSSTSKSNNENTCCKVTISSNSSKNMHSESSKNNEKSLYSNLMDSSPQLSEEKAQNQKRMSEIQENNKHFLNDETRQAVENIRGTMAAIADRRVLFFSESPRSPVLSPSSRLSYEFDPNTKSEGNFYTSEPRYNSINKPSNNYSETHTDIKDITNPNVTNVDPMYKDQKLSKKHSLTESSTISSLKLKDNLTCINSSNVDHMINTSIPNEISAVKLNCSDGAMYLRHLSFPRHSEFSTNNWDRTTDNNMHHSPEIKYFSVPEGDSSQNYRTSNALWMSSTKPLDSEKVFLSDTLLNNDHMISPESKSFKIKKSSKSQNPKIQSPSSKHKKSSAEKDGTSGSHKESWKGKVARTIMKYGSGTILSAADPNVVSNAAREVAGVIGVPLESCQPSPNNPFVPFIVEVCTGVVEERGLDCLGIYRVPGNTGAIKELQDEINKDPKQLCLHNEKWQDVNLVTSLLKLFFRRLPDSLITDDMYEATINANRTENAEKRMLRLKKLLHELPEHNFCTLQHLAHHLNLVASHEDNNKMDIHNLAIMFGPTLIRPRDNNLVAMAKNMGDQCRIVETILSHCEWFFSSWDEDVNVPVDEEGEDVTPISHINDQMVAKAQSLVASNSSCSLAPNNSNRHLSFTNFSSLRSSAKSRFRSKDNRPTDAKNSLEPMRAHSSVDSAVPLDVKFTYRPAFKNLQMLSASTENLKTQIMHASSCDKLNLPSVNP